MFGLLMNSLGVWRISVSILVYPKDGRIYGLLPNNGTTSMIKFFF